MDRHLIIALDNGVTFIARGNGRMELITGSAIPAGSSIVVRAGTLKSLQELIEEALNSKNEKERKGE